MHPLRRHARLVADTCVGYALLVAGAVMLLTPGPGLVAIVAGLAVLGRHYRWAGWVKRIGLGRLQDATTRLRVRARSPHDADGEPPPARRSDRGSEAA